jgi:hypothetical protein
MWQRFLGQNNVDGQTLHHGTKKAKKKSSLRLAYPTATLGFHLLLFPALQHVKM